MKEDRIILISKHFRDNFITDVFVIFHTFDIFTQFISLT